MNYARQLLSAMSLAFFFAMIAIAPAGAAPGDEAPAQAQAEKPSATVRFKAWSRSRLMLETKRWAEDRKRFSACVNELTERQKVSRLSVRKQVRFLESCMARKQ